MMYAKKRKLKIFHLNGISANFCCFIIGDLSPLLPEPVTLLYLIVHASESLITRVLVHALWNFSTRALYSTLLSLFESDSLSDFLMNNSIDVVDPSTMFCRCMRSSSRAFAGDDFILLLNLSLVFCSVITVVRGGGISTTYRYINVCNEWMNE